MGNIMPETIKLTHPDVTTCNSATDNGFCLCGTCTLFFHYCPPCSKDDWTQETSADCEITQCDKYSSFKFKIKMET